MRFLFWLAVVLGTVTPVSAGTAAVIEDISDIIMISRGNGYTRIDQHERVRPGDALMARRGGSARLVYADGCSVAITSDTVVVVQPTSPCAAGQPVPDASRFAFGAAAALSTTIVILRSNRVPISP